MHKIPHDTSSHAALPEQEMRCYTGLCQQLAESIALCARLDKVISLEKRIVGAQVRCIILFSERIAPASEIVKDSLELLSRMLMEKIGNMAQLHLNTSLDLNNRLVHERKRLTA